MEKATRRGNYESGSDYVLEYGELRFSFNEQDFGQRVEQAAVKLDFVESGPLPRGAPGPARPRRQRRDPRAVLVARRAHRRQLDRAGRPGEPQPRPLDPPARLPRRLARPARQGGRAGRRLRAGHAPPSATSSPIATPSRSSSPASPPGLVSPTGPSGLEARQQLGVRGRSPRSARAGRRPPRSGRGRRAAARSLRIASSSAALAQRLLVGDAALGGDDRGMHADRGELGVEGDHGALGRPDRALGRALVARRRRAWWRRSSASRRPARLRPAPNRLFTAATSPAAKSRRESESTSRTASPPVSAWRRARASASSARRSCSPGAISAVAIANWASGTASRQAVASSGRSSTSRTMQLDALGGGDRVRRCRAGAWSGPIAARPAPARAGPAPAAPADRRHGRGRRSRRRRAAAAARGRSRAAPRSAGRSGTGGSAPFTRSTWTSARWRSPRRGSRAGPATSSPERSSQRRTCEAET